MRLIDWVKHNKLAAFLLIIVALYIARSLLSTFLGVSLLQFESAGSAGGLSALSLPSYPAQDYAPQPDVKDRLVIQESSLSLLVRDVVDARNEILKYTQDSGGYMVSVNTSSPQDAPTASVIVRIPSEKLDEALAFFRSLAIKVVSENLVGRDVTDQYVDIDTRISQIERSKARLKEILESATQISDITNLTQQILSYQNQIDSLKGQQDALEKNAQLAKLTIYLSTDEIALPYAPSETFRPQVIFKLAVRSLVGFLRKIATAAIWIGVFSVVWVPALGVYIGFRRWRAKRKSKNPAT